MAEKEADELKIKGNRHLQEGKFDEAISCYSEAIEICPKNHVLFSNRSAAFAKKSLYKESLVDAQKTVELAPSWAKGYSRLGAAYTYLGRYTEAKQAYEDGLKHDKDNDQLKSGLEDVKKRMSTQSRNMPGNSAAFSPFGGPEVQAKLLADPSTTNLMSDPEFMKILHELQHYPESLKRYISDPRVMQALSVILGINVESSEAHNKNEHEPEHDLPTEERKMTDKNEIQKEETAATLTEKQRMAVDEKQNGNEAYKKRDFLTALQCYEKAFQLDPTNMTYLTNKAAVYFEQKKFPECIKECQEAVELGRNYKADYKLIAKAFGRIGNAYFAQEMYEEAVKYYNKSLIEHRASDIVRRCQEAEKIIKENERLAYLDADKALEERNKGNEAFSNGDYPQAIKHYTESIKRNPEDERTYSNRAACYTKLAEFKLALKDCDDCIKMNPEFIKGHLRKGAALLALKENAKAAESYQTALGLDPNCKEARDGIYNCSLAKMSSDPEQRRKDALNDPEVQAIMMDPAMRLILEQMQEDPKAAAEHLRNPVVATKIQKLMEAGVLSMR